MMPKDQKDHNANKSKADLPPEREILSFEDGD